LCQKALFRRQNYIRANLSGESKAHLEQKVKSSIKTKRGRKVFPDGKENTRRIIRRIKKESLAIYDRLVCEFRDCRGL